MRDQVDHPSVIAIEFENGDRFVRCKDRYRWRTQENADKGIDYIWVGADDLAEKMTSMKFELIEGDANV